MCDKNMITMAKHKQKLVNINKKKPPPRPPPPNFSKFKSKSTVNLNQQFENFSLIDLSPPNSPKDERTRVFGGSVSSSFSSSTSSLASSKKSLEYETLPLTSNCWPSNQNSALLLPPTSSTTRPMHNALQQTNVPSLFGPTIIRAQVPKKNFKIQDQVDSLRSSSSSSLPMPRIPPPSPPKSLAEVETPYGIALFEFPATHPSDLALQVNDVVMLIRRINSEWLYGRVLDKEGMFPANFVDVLVPLLEDDRTVTALYEFRPQVVGDLELKAGQSIRVIKKISDEWLYGEAGGRIGQFPSNFVDRIPKSL